MYRSILKIFLIAAAAAAAVLCIRFFLVEPDAVAKNCIVDANDFLCRIRHAAVYGFSRHLYGPISLAMAAVAAVGRLRAFAILAVGVGMAGVILYDFDLAAIGVLAGALLFARFDVLERAERERRQRAPYTPV